MSQPNPANRATPQPDAVPRAAARFAGTPHSTTGAAPAPAAPLRRRLDGRRTQATRPPARVIAGVPT